MFSLLKHAKKYRIQIILGPVFKFMEAVFELLLPLYMARLVDQGIRANDQAYVVKTGITMLAMSVIGLVCVLICQYFSSFASQGFGTELRNQLLKKINTLSHKELNELGTSTLITRMTSDINQLQLALAMFIRLVIRAPFLSIGSIFMAFYIDSQMTFVFILVLPIFCFILYWMMKKTVPLYKIVQKKVDHLNQAIRESLTGVRVIRAFAREKEEEVKVNQITDDLAYAYKQVANISALLNPATTFMMNLAIILLLYIGGSKVNIGSLQQGEVLALINYMMQMLLALIVVSNLVVIFTRASASASRVNEIFAIQPEIQDEFLPTNLSEDLKDKETSLLHFSQVSFRYNEKSGLALKDIEFSIQKNSVLGIIGPTGSGKSTLTQLIPRFYDPTQGKIYLNGSALPHYTLHEIRKKVGIVPQTSVLFTGTIKENLQWGKTDASNEECWKALEISQGAEFVKALPNQLNEMVFANGKNFSGGQKQRLAIARAVIKQPDILILDDSLSALDYQTDLYLRQALTTHLKDCTLLIVSQRVSSVKHADRILVLHDGEQAGFDTHENLMKISPVYQEIVLSQEEMEEDNHA